MQLLTHTEAIHTLSSSHSITSNNKWPKVGGEQHLMLSKLKCDIPSSMITQLTQCGFTGASCWEVLSSADVKRIAQRRRRRLISGNNDAYGQGLQGYYCTVRMI